ncbi:MAG: thiol-disulfide oxidoreductase DCC family protein [Cyclobacteriaceae bacterium]|nr:thiol-disulfide oxidoreductase DCC family protein [Cyclobacteriaceae bacterium]MCB9238787.1 thiol-disulfide oxidoreductase DCC family protein [Flammeovirgaceae bacterium]MCB0498063.1 thiol-disulfide oxidoreductase DCC family protein [Cyclobacteriaceae bacterium]MCO5270506.1 thiol-disulfide oxidoreductase DCC family protein [Cyclobacteriaceae bacterium]MCW5901053.1 thiol-disulfide oxidoreductase DCC family protein [Cyclobacteriaceae bacterium]
MGAPGTVVNAVVLFDGACNLCNGSVQFIIRHDSRAQFYFAPLQSPYGQAQLRKFGIPPMALNTLALIKGDRLYQRSNAVLEIARKLGGFLPALYLLKVIPTFLRDWVYNGVAKNRYRWFGRQDKCMVPSPSLKARFLDEAPVS